MDFQHHTILVPAATMEECFTSILLGLGFPEERAAVCAGIFTSNSVDGIYSHGVNRFLKFVGYVQNGYVQPEAEFKPVSANGGFEQWDASYGPGPWNAHWATARAVEQAGHNGISCIGLRNSNHWMRGGYYGWQAARQGAVFIGWSNTIANMPAWGTSTRKLGNNPLVLALPFEGEAIVLDMALSQFSYGAMEMAAMQKTELPVYGGYDEKGELTRDPEAILGTHRPLPIGYWKGSGLSLLLDMLAVLLSGGSSVAEITGRGEEFGLSQVFMVIRPGAGGWHDEMEARVREIILDLNRELPAGEKSRYPGEKVLETRKRNLEQGIPVMVDIWKEIEITRDLLYCKS